MIEADKPEPVSPDESALIFSCEGSQLIGILHHAENSEKIGLVIVVGGPQTRVGSHRQFVQLARTLAANGIPVLRFDYRGMGDSDGTTRDFEHVNEDIRAAIDVMQERGGVDRVILWGLCDAVPAITAYAATDERVRGIALLNPWVRTTTGIAKAYMRTYYIRRLFSREFWVRTIHGELNFFESVSSFVATFRRSLHFKGERLDAENSGDMRVTLPLPDRMIDGVDRFDGSVLLVMSGNDITAQEFHSIVEVSPSWRRLLNRGRVMRREITDADHTFSNRVWSKQVEEWTVEWVKML